MSNLYNKALVGLLLLFLVMAALLFIPPWTLDYWQAWTFLAVYFAASIAISLYLIKGDPQLLARRMSGGPAAEKRPAQKIIMSLTSLGFIGLLVVPALDRRFAWSLLPAGVALAGDALVVLGWVGIFFVFRENSFASATALVMLLGIPIALGSMWGVLVIVAILPALIWRLLDEEKFLAKNLPGYPEYQARVRYRLIPRVW